MAIYVYQIVRENDGTYTVEVTQDGVIHFSLQNLKSKEEALEQLKARERLTAGFDQWVRAPDKRRLRL
jgi:hypothetical protein